MNRVRSCISSRINVSDRSSLSLERCDDIQNRTFAGRGGRECHLSFCQTINDGMDTRLRVDRVSHRIFAWDSRVSPSSASYDNPARPPLFRLGNFSTVGDRLPQCSRRGALLREEASCLRLLTREIKRRLRVFGSAATWPFGVHHSVSSFSIVISGSAMNSSRPVVDRNSPPNSTAVDLNRLADGSVEPGVHGFAIFLRVAMSSRADEQRNLVLASSRRYSRCNR